MNWIGFFCNLLVINDLEKIGIEKGFSVLDGEDLSPVKVLFAPDVGFGVHFGFDEGFAELGELEGAGDFGFGVDVVPVDLGVAGDSGDAGFVVHGAV